MTLDKHNTINFSRHEINSLHYTNSSDNNEGYNNETQNCDEAKQKINASKPKFLPENVKWDGNVEVADIDWSESFIKPSTGLPTYPINVIDFSDGKIRERDIQWPDNDNAFDNNFQETYIKYSNLEDVIDSSNDIESQQNVDIESLQCSISDVDTTSSAIIDLAHQIKSIAINDDDIEFSEICTQEVSHNSINDVYDLYGGMSNSECSDHSPGYSESCGDENEAYQWDKSGDIEAPNQINQADSWSESSYTLQTKYGPDQNHSKFNDIQHSSKSNVTIANYIRRRRRPRSYLEQRKDPRYNPDTNHWKSEADYLSFDGQERIDLEKRENEKYDAVIQAALDAWGAHKDVTMDVFKTKPTKDIKKSNAIIFEEDDIVPPTILSNQNLPPKETPKSKSPIMSSQTCPVDSSSSQSVVLHQYSQSNTTSLPLVFHEQSYVSPLLQALYKRNIAQANSVAKYLDRFKINLSPILSVELPADIEIEVRQNSKWPAYYADVDKNERRYSCEETIKKALHHIMHSRAVQLLSEPLSQRTIIAPIIVIAKSSLTLDKLLVELIHIFPNLIRVGSSKQCRNRSLAGRQVDNLQNEISTLYNRQIEHLKDARIDLLKRIKERFTLMSDYYFLQSAPSQFKKQLSRHNNRKTNSISRNVELKDLMNWLSSDNPRKFEIKRSTTLFEESTTHRPFKFSINKTPLREILSSTLENLFTASSTDLYSKISLPLMFSSIEELEKILSFDDDDSNDIDSIYSPNIEESQFINNLINHLPQDQKLLFNKQNQPANVPNDLKNDINQFWCHVAKDIWKISIDERKLYRHMFNRIVSNYYDPIITNIYTNAIELNNTMDEKRLQKLSEVMKGAPVIGFSWKNAKCLKKLFHDSSPASTPVFIVDEASEIPEDEISCIINDHENLDHLVMIGDMNRRCGNSLFERWILDGGRHYRLSEQIRVHPQINNLLSTFHKRIADDFPFLKNNSQITGTTSNVYFLNHQNYDEVPVSISKNMINTIEAEFVTKFAFYLHQQDADFDPGNITILTPFIAQRELIKSLLAPELIKEKTVKIREIIPKEVGMHNYEPEFAQKIIVTEKKLGRVIVQLIDDYRYEENQIVILSLVAVPQRWQKEALTILSTKDLVYTALSRATRGLYIFGDGDTLKNVPIWADIIKKTINESAYGSELVLSCQNHGVKTKISHPDHFKQYVPLGGCMMPCEKMLLCGHKCPRKCHPIPHSQERDRFKCEEICHRKSKVQIRNCNEKQSRQDLIYECTHPCERKCHECYEEGSCGICEEEIDHKFDGCCHKATIKCHERRYRKCEDEISVKLKCGHIEKVPCHKRLNVDEHKCTRPKDVEIQTCGHFVRVDCFVTNPECIKRCGYILPCGHKCEERCAAHKNHIHRRSDCKRECPKTLVCGHKCINGCAEPDQHSSSCMEECTFQCLHGIGCPFQCNEPCFECLENCPLTCKHTKCTKRCWEDCDRPPCNKPCTETLKCGHTCNGLCGEPCPPCKKCNPNIECPITLTKIGEFSDEERCYMLPECRCVFMVEALDQYFNEKLSV
ncbi:10128_t:CDS:2, partial [Cetraspora pellucida]